MYLLFLESDGNTGLDKPLIVPVTVNGLSSPVFPSDCRLKYCIVFSFIARFLAGRTQLFIILHIS